MKALFRFALKFGIYAVLFTYPLAPSEAGYLVYGVRPDFPMSEGQKIFRDIYVNMGSAQGIKIGSKLDIYRTQNTVDQINQKSAQNITFKIAQAKVIHVENNVAVARVQEFANPEEIPNTNSSDVMAGDSVEVSNK